MNDVKVVCHELGYKYGVRVLRAGNVPTGTGKIWLNHVSCTGTEQSLSSCSHDGWGNNSCWHRQDAGVECSSTGN